MDSIQDHGSGKRSRTLPRRGERLLATPERTIRDIDIPIETADDTVPNGFASPAPARPGGANWVAAYAMGLASARGDDASSRRDLVEAAEGASERLEQARERLQKLDGFDDVLRQRAEQLVTASLEQTAVED